MHMVANEQDGAVRSLTAEHKLLCHRGNRSSPSLRHAHVLGTPMLLCAQSLSAPLRQALHRAARAVKSQSGKALLRKRGMHLERGFEHILDQGGLRRATLKGTENLTKCYQIAAACINLSLLMRTLLRVGTPKHTEARLIAP